MYYQIAIDGPSGSGKSSIAKILAERLNFVYINTGLIFRAIAYIYQVEKFSFPEECINFLKTQILNYTDNKIYINENNITNFLQSNDIAKLSSKLATSTIIRNFVLEIEHKIANDNNVIMDGRDIGTIVFPNAVLKIFLTASSKIRANRRYQQLKELNILKNLTIDLIEVEIKLRDIQDQNRLIAPLKKANDAIEICSDNFSIEEIVFIIQNFFLEKLKLLNT